MFAQFTEATLNGMWNEQQRSCHGTSIVVSLPASCPNPGCDIFHCFAAAPVLLDDLGSGGHVGCGLYLLVVVRDPNHDDPFLRESRTLEGPVRIEWRDTE